jgi:nucleotide-binding universal stress UspA family protein
VLHVLTEAVGDEVRARQIALKVENDLRRKILELSPRHEGTVSFQVATGTPSVEIIHRARAAAADLVIVGAHGAHSLKDFLVGTTAEKIVRKGNCPVLVVKQSTQRSRRSYRRVLGAVDFSDHCRHALELALRIAAQAEFHAVHVYSGFDQMLRRASVVDSEIVRYQQQIARQAHQDMETFIDSIEREHKPIRMELWRGRPRDEIMAVSMRLRADLVAVGTAGRTGIPHILLGSVAEHVMREASCDLLVARSRSLRFDVP